MGCYHWFIISFIPLSNKYLLKLCQDCARCSAYNDEVVEVFLILRKYSFVWEKHNK